MGRAGVQRGRGLAASGQRPAAQRRWFRASGEAPAYSASAEAACWPGVPASFASLGFGAEQAAPSRGGSPYHRPLGRKRSRPFPRVLPPAGVHWGRQHNAARMSHAHRCHGMVHCCPLASTPGLLEGFRRTLANLAMSTANVRDAVGVSVVQWWGEETR